MSKLPVKTLNGPKGIKLILDPNEVFPDDPGAGTPAMVEYKNSCGSYNYVIYEGECNDGVKVPQECLDWLCSEEIEYGVEELYQKGSKGE